MVREHLKAATEKAKGAVKETVGKVTGDPKLQGKGKADRAKGAARKFAADVKDHGSERLEEYEDE
jgi:uncharacterized protein YjbJ (UPF0337 family)